MLNSAMLLWFACTGSEPSGVALLSFELTAGPDAAPLATHLAVETDRATSLVVVATSGKHRVEFASDVARSQHDMPLLGLRAGQDYTVEVTLTAADGARATDALDLETAHLPPWFPDFEVVAHDPERAEPGYTVLSCRLSANVPHDLDLALVVDPQGHVVYWFDEGDHMMDVRLAPDGLWVIAGEPSAELFAVDWYGNPRMRFHSSAWGGTGIAVDAPGRFHHDWVPTDDGGGIVLSKEDRTVDYPVAYDTPEVLSPQLVTQDVVVRFDAAGAMRWQLHLGDLLDPARIGFDALDPGRDDPGLDWTHANAIIEDVDGSIIVSLRNQDALVKLDPDTGTVVWILGTPYGWSEAYVPLLLIPQGPLQWPYHQHGPSLAPDGSLVVFDNGNHGSSPGQVLVADLPDDTELFSRVVRYDIDAVRGTVRQLNSFESADGHTVFSEVVGDADWLPGGTVLGTFGAVFIEDGVHNLSVGLAKRSTRVVEWDPDTGDEVWHLRGTLSNAVSDIGWNTYRAERFASFYGPEVRVDVQ